MLHTIFNKGCGLMNSINLQRTNKFAEQLLSKRLSLKLTQVEMAKKLNLSPYIYDGIESGTYKINLMIISRVSKFLQITASEAYSLYQDKNY